MKMYNNSQPFQPRGTQGRSIKKLNSFRNNFIHFVPKSWLIEVSGLPLIVDDCLDTISFLAFGCGNIIWYDEELKSLTKAYLEKSKQSVGKIKQGYLSIDR